MRRLLHARGWRFRVDYQPVPGLRRRADVAFTRLRVAVFIDGCFWHACPLHGTQAKANAAFWAEKLATNVSRDRDTDRRLREAGWTVVRAWEHESPDDVVQLLEAVLRAANARSRSLTGRSVKTRVVAELDSSGTSR